MRKLGKVCLIIAFVMVFVIISNVLMAAQARPTIVIEKKIEESVVRVNETFTVEVLFHNSGRATAINLYVRDRAPKGVTVIDGNTSWFGDLVSFDGDGFVYTAMASSKGYLNLGPAFGIYNDSNNLTQQYLTASNNVEVYVEPSTATLLDYIDKYQQPIQIAGSIGGVILGAYGVYEKFFRGKARKKKGKDDYPAVAG